MDEMIDVAVELQTEWMFVTGALLIVAAGMAPLGVHAWRTLSTLPHGRSGVFAGGAAIAMPLVATMLICFEDLHKDEDLASVASTLSPLAFTVGFLALIGLAAVHAIVFASAAKVRFLR